MQLVLATNNKDKIREIRDLLDDLPVTILTAEDFLEFPEPAETGATLEENAVFKARVIADFAGLPALADDSGLEVDALDGAPGVYSSRYAADEISGRKATYRDNNTKLLRELDGVPAGKRTARFRCVIAIAWDEDDVETVEGVAEGYITDDIVGYEGFGYDPVFYYPPKDRRFSEMTLEEKNLVSHRGKALMEARTLIINKLNEMREG